MRFGLLVLLLMITAAQASDAGKRVKYVPPEGFAGHKWEDLRGSFDRLPEQPMGVGAAWMRTQQKQNAFTCVPNASVGQQTVGRAGFLQFPGDAAAAAQ